MTAEIDEDDNTKLILTPVEMTPDETPATVVVKENNGNSSIEISVTVINASSPRVKLTTESYDGAEYASGTETYSGVYHTVKMHTDKTITKYQYTKDNGTTWNDMPETTTKESPTYTSTFPLQTDGKPRWLGNVTKGGSNYCFDISGGKLTSAGTNGNKGISSSYCRSYIPIDLTKYSLNDTLTLELNYTISSQINNDFGYAAITTSTKDPTSGYFMRS